MFRTDKSCCSSTWRLHEKNSFAYLSRWDTWCLIGERWENPVRRTWLHLFWFSISFSLNKNSLRIFGFSAGTFWSRSSLPSLRTRFSFRVSSFHRAYIINTRLWFIFSRNSWLFAKVRRASCSFGNVTSSFRGFFCSAANFPSLLPKSWV